MKVYDNKWSLCRSWVVRQQKRLDRAKWIVERIHEYAAKQVDNGEILPFHPRVNKSAARHIRRKIERPDNPQVVIGQHLLDVRLRPDMIASCDDVCAGVTELAGGSSGDATAARAIFAIDDDQISIELRAQSWKYPFECPSTRRTVHVADRQHVDRVVWTVVI